MNRILPILNILGFVLFAVFSWFQREDNDTLIYENPSQIDMWMWILFYALISICFGLAVFRKIFWPLLGVAAAWAIFYLCASGPGLWDNIQSGKFSLAGPSEEERGMNPNHPEIEISREFFGALISLGAIGFLAWQKRRQTAMR